MKGLGFKVESSWVSVQGSGFGEGQGFRACHRLVDGLYECTLGVNLGAVFGHAVTRGLANPGLRSVRQIQSED